MHTVRVVNSEITHEPADRIVSYVTAIHVYYVFLVIEWGTSFLVGPLDMVHRKVISKRVVFCDEDDVCLGQVFGVFAACDRAGVDQAAVVSRPLV